MTTCAVAALAVATQGPRRIAMTRRRNAGAASTWGGSSTRGDRIATWVG
ncbi:hypothetical protein SCE1572_22115 [Sorangium cellulosum So0157-2]|uniref:Uncharacterized protein n=1 Tax=Sorangium cellulosum So0157-2 TaxID=1254432 RepID=S4XWU7_SORCE|nr:hypothetical protein SCE1572_22115 [Sorangium cellulosum So0157-2]